MTPVEKVKKDLAGWRLSRRIWVMDRGMCRYPFYLGHFDEVRRLVRYLQY